GYWMEIEKALLLGEEKSLESQLTSDTKEVRELRARLDKLSQHYRQWKSHSLDNISSLKAQLISYERQLEQLEKLQATFDGDTDEETALLEKLKLQHELIETTRKVFEDAEFHHMEEEINNEAQREEITKSLSELDRRVFAVQAELVQLQSQNRVSFGASAKEIQSLEKKRQELIKDLQHVITNKIFLFWRKFPPYNIFVGNL
ncbi:unnamed protein product, partial [Allacma fusca]